MSHQRPNEHLDAEQVEHLSDPAGGVGGPEIEPTDIDPLADPEERDPERLDAMSADGRIEPGDHLDGPDIQHPTNWRIT